MLKKITTNSDKRTMMKARKMSKSYWIMLTMQPAVSTLTSIISSEIKGVVFMNYVTVKVVENVEISDGDLIFQRSTYIKF